MPNPTWPLTYSWGTNVQRTPDANVIRTQMEVGPAKMRRRSTADAIGTPFDLLITTAEKATIQTFYLTTLLKVGVFDYTDYSVSPTVTKTYRFRSAPRYRYQSGSYWIVTIDIEELP